MAGGHVPQHRTPRIPLHVSDRLDGPRPDSLRFCRNGRHRGLASPRSHAAERTGVGGDLRSVESEANGQLRVETKLELCDTLCHRGVLARR